MANMGTVWDRTVEFLSDNVGSVTPIALLAIFVPTSISNSLQDLQADPMSALSAGLGLVSLLLGLAVLWGNVAITALVLDPALEGRASAAATRRFPAVVGLWLLLLAMTLALTLPIVAILSLGGVDFATLTPETVPNVGAGAAGAAALYGLVLLVALLFLFARLAVVLAVVVAEGGIFSAIGRSFRLTRGSTLKIAGVIILYLVVMLVATVAAKMLFGSLLAIFIGGEGQLNLAKVLTSILVATVQTGFTVLAAAFTAQLYLALQRERTAAAR